MSKSIWLIKSNDKKQIIISEGIKTVAEIDIEELKEFIESQNDIKKLD